jgi:hypothetical protein
VGGVPVPSHARRSDPLQGARLAIGAFATGEVEEVDNYAARDATLAFELVGSDPERAAAAALILQEFDITPSEILAQAYSRVSAQVEMHE